MASPQLLLAAPPWALERGADSWPKGLDDLPGPPERVRVVGALPSLARSVSIVGTRYADPEAIAFTRGLAADLCSVGMTIVSGGARGIDRAAHEGALDAQGATIAVLPSGFDPVYPSRHAPLFAAIAGTGALLSELPDGTPPLKGTFLQRNRLVAALGQTVVVVQAPHRSGALSTGAWALRLGRRLLVVPGAPWDPRAAGCLWLLRRGAGVCTSAADVLSVPAAEAAAMLPGDKNSPDVDMLDDDAQTVLSALGPRPRHPDEVAGSLDLPPGRVLEVLLGLELAGLAGTTGGGYRRVVD